MATKVEVLFQTLSPTGEPLRSSVLTEALEDAGLKESVIRKAIKKLDPDRTRKIPLETFLQVAELDNGLILRALLGQLVVPDFREFCTDLRKLFEEVKKNKGGANADYIPQLARVDPDQFGLSVYTVDSQVFNIGDVDVGFTVQSCSKPVTYALAETLLGVETITNHVGHEPSGKSFNAFVLDSHNLPHNPMINAGAIMTASLLRPDLEPADRFDYVLSVWKRLAGDSHIGFDNATYLSELRHADRNFALAYFMKGAGAFGDNVRTSEQLQSNLEFYFQCCSIFATCEDMASVAATLANGGVHPTTGDRVFSATTVRNTLSLMFSCGMYDYSGEYAYSIGLPAKSGVAGCIMCVVPNVMGMCTWSPPLDEQGNSTRGVDFFTRLTEKYALHVFDDVSSGAQSKKNIRARIPMDVRMSNIAELCYAASIGDLSSVKELLMAGLDVKSTDYDKRTPLHLAAAEGRLKVTQFLLDSGADPHVEDRWGVTPLVEAEQNGHMKTLAAIKQHIRGAA